MKKYNFRDEKNTQKTQEEWFLKLKFKLPGILSANRPAGLEVYVFPALRGLTRVVSRQQTQRDVMVTLLSTFTSREAQVHFTSLPNRCCLRVTMGMSTYRISKHSSWGTAFSVFTDLLSWAVCSHLLEA